MKERAGATLTVSIIVMAFFTSMTVVLSRDASAASWDISIVDRGLSVGKYSSIAVDSWNFPHISYFNGSSSTLKYARLVSGYWRLETVDSVSGSGYYTSLEMDSNNLAHISYFSTSSNTLKYARNTLSGWNIETVDASPMVGQYSSLALDSKGFSHIAYYDGTNFDLKYANNTYGFWKTVTVDSFSDVGTYASIAIDSNDWPRIAYHDQNLRDLKFASWNGTAWVVKTVDSAGDVGRYASLAIDRANRAHISYYDFTTMKQFSLKYALSSGSGWTILTVDEEWMAYIGSYNSIAVDSNGYPQIAYHWIKAISPSANNYELRCAKWTGSGWSITTIEGPYLYQVGVDTSIVIDSAGETHISNHDPTGGSLKYVRSVPNTPPGKPVRPSGPTSGFVGIGYTYSTRAIDPDNDRIRFRFDWGDGPSVLTGFVDSNATINVAHAWGNSGTYAVKAMAIDTSGATSPWSDSLYVTIEPLPGPPEAPTNLMAMAGDRKINLGWVPPAYDGGSPITNYRIYRGTTPGGEVFLTEIGNNLGYVDLGLTNGQTYYYMVSAKNANGEGVKSNEASATPGTIPGPPMWSNATAGDRKVTLMWLPPSDDGGAPITNYSVYQGTVPNVYSLLVVLGNQTSYIDYGLVNGQTYYYRLTASNIWGEGIISDDISATPIASPSRPLNLQAVPGNGQVGLTWDPPADYGGFPITNYIVFRGLSSGLETRLTEIGNVSMYMDTGLVNGQTYFYQLGAKNAIGAESERSNEVSATPSTVPGAPESLAALPGDGCATLSWSAPADDGGLPITNYTVYRGLTSNGETPLITIGNLLSYVDSGLENGRTYYYKVSAWNGAGEGNRSDEVSVVPSTVPSQPLNLQAVAGDGQVYLQWDVPLSDGGSPIVGYRVYRGVTSGGETALVTIGNVLEYVDGGVVNGNTYYYQVAALNPVGEGGRSNEAQATPSPAGTPPSPPLGLTCDPGNTRVILAWNAPVSDGGSPVTNYMVYRRIESGTEAFLVEIGNLLTYTDEGLTNGVTYYYRVSGKNQFGEGAKSNEAGATPASTPGPPTALYAVAEEGRVTLTWAAPLDDGGLPVLNYRIYRGTVSGGELFLTTVTGGLSFVDFDVVNGQTYYYQVSAVNGHGEGDLSYEVSATPTSIVPDGEAVRDWAWLWLLLVLLVFLVSFIFVVIILWRRRRKRLTIVVSEVSKNETGVDDGGSER